MPFTKYKGRYYYGYFYKDDNNFVLRTRNKAEGFELHHDEYRKIISVEDVEDFFELKYYARVRDEDNEIISTKNYLSSVDIYGPYAWEKYYQPIARFDIGNGVLRVPIDEVEYVNRDITYYRSPDFDKECPEPKLVRTKLTIQEFQNYHGSIVNNLCWYNENY